jgi:pyridoxamine 5'-phosphate oxidase
VSRPQTASDLADLRKEYIRSGLREDDAHPNPIEQFRKWFEEALTANLHEPNAMTLATAFSGGIPSARVVLLKGFDERGFVFYTNHEGRKGQELEENPYCALVFYWGELERQVRVEGRASRVSAEESDEYYRSRPRGSRLSAWASEQSRPVAGRDPLEERLRRLEDEYEGREVPRPPFWGGYRVGPEAIEFWQGRENRLHDRLLYRCSSGGGWIMERLQP